jgi:2-hydroxyglutarate dehydrogenase
MTQTQQPRTLYQKRQQPRTLSQERERVDGVVIGAGVVGIAVARALALKGREVIVIESASSFGTGTSLRNCEVVHAGIYYPRHSFKVGVVLCCYSFDFLIVVISRYCVGEKIKLGI